jgi:hypothetical protein
MIVSPNFTKNSPISVSRGFCVLKEPENSLSCPQDTDSGHCTMTVYNVRVLDQFWPPFVPCYALTTPFGLLSPFISIPITRNYNHTQLFLTRLRVYTLTILIRSWLLSLIPLLHVYTVYVHYTAAFTALLHIKSSLTDFSTINYCLKLSHTLHLLSPIETSLVGLLLKNCSRGLLVTNWLCCRSRSHIATDGQSVSKSWCRAPSGAHDQVYISIWQLRSCFCGAPSLTRGWVCLF